MRQSAKLELARAAFAFAEATLADVNCPYPNVHVKADSDAELKRLAVKFDRTFRRIVDRREKALARYLLAREAAGLAPPPRGGPWSMVHHEYADVTA